MAAIATYEDVKNIPSEAYLIDVRNPEELDETGELPRSINIPLSELGETISLDNEKFKEKFGRDKPKVEDRIITSCKSGRRAENAATQLEGLGFTNLAYYKGSWTDWAEKEKSGLLCDADAEECQ